MRRVGRCLIEPRLVDLKRCCAASGLGEVIYAVFMCSHSIKSCGDDRVMFKNMRKLK